jgi:hypothetical protein
MKIIVKTLLDITETKKHKHNCYDKLSVNQQGNFMSFFNCLSMRFNPYYEVSPTVEEQTVEGLGFGSDYTGTQNVWTFEFDIETSVAGIDKQTLVEDFDLIPMIPGLTESITINNNVFMTTDKKKRNIVFILPDNDTTE